MGPFARVLLAYEPRDFWDEYVARGPLAAPTPNTPTSPERLVRELEQVRETGFAVSDEDVVLGMAAVGAPIFDHQGAIRAAVSMSGPRPTILGEQADESRELVASAAAEISLALGFDAAELETAEAPV